MPQQYSGNYIIISNILTKLQLAHRTQAVIYALKKGLISLDEIDLP